MAREIEKYSASSITDKGARNLNEDSYLILKKDSGLNKGYMLLVADGLGGLERGEIVSGYIKQSLKKWYEEKAESLFLMSTHDIKISLNEEIYSIHDVLLTNSRTKNTSYGSTLTCMLCMNSRYVIGHVGDSRCYISYRNNVRQLTKDQTLYQRQIDNNLEIKESERKKMQSTLLQCIGHGRVSPRYYEGILPDEYEIMLCTDGFYRKLSYDDIAKFFLSRKEPKEKLEIMLKIIKERKEQDNITAVLLRKEYEEAKYARD